MPYKKIKPTSKSRNYFMSVKKFALIMCLLACFFVAGVLLGCYIGYRYRLLDKHSALEKSEKVKAGCLFNEVFQDHHKVAEEISQIYDSFGVHIASGYISDEVLRKIFKSMDETKELLMTELNLTQLNSFATYTYDIKIYKYHAASTSFIMFSLPNLSVVKEKLDNFSFFYSPGGIFEADAVLLDERDEGFESIDVELIAGNVMVVPYDSFYFAKIHALEHLGVQAVLFYDKIELKDCKSNSLKFSQKSSVFPGDPFTPGYSAIDGIYNIPEDETTAFKIPVEFMSCQTARKILPYLRQGSQNNSKAVSVHLELSKELQSQKVSNFILPFHGGKEPKVSIVIGSSRKGQRGTERLMKLMKALSLVLHDGWIPRRTIKFISWDSQNLGMSEFVETFKLVWNEEVIAYIDLDDYSSDDKFHFVASSSLKKLVDEVIQKKHSKKASFLRVEVKTDRIGRQTGGQLFEQEMGIPYFGISGETVQAEETEMLKILSSVMLFLVNTEVLQISPQKTFVDLCQSIKDLQTTFPFVSDKIPALQKLFSKLSTAMKRFEKFIQSDLGMESGRGKEILNDVILKVESQQRVMLHKLWRLNKKPPFKLLQKLNVSREYCQFSENVQILYGGPSDCNSTFEMFLLREVSVIVSKLQGILEVLNYRD